MRISIIYLAIAISLGVILTQSIYWGNWKQGYESQSAKAKQDYLWQRIMENTKAGNEPSMFQIAKLAAPTMLGGLDFGVTGNRNADQIPEGRYKGIHAVGIVCKAKFNWTNKQAGFTGAFQQADHVIIRMSGATSLKSGYVPNLAVKVLRNGVSSGNTFFSHAISPQKTGNWFENNMCNHVPRLDAGFSLEGAKNAVLNKIFAKAGDIPTMLGVSEIADYTQNGQKVSNIKSPFIICIRPKKAMTERNRNAKDEGDNFGQLSNIPENTVLYEVFGMSEPLNDAELKSENGKSVHYLGTLQTTSKCTPSNFGDKELFFKHTYWKKELEVTGKQSTWGKKINDSFNGNAGQARYAPFFNQAIQSAKRRLRLSKHH